LTAAVTASLCVKVLPGRQSSERGQAAAWDVTAWTTRGTLPDATVTLRAAPAGSGSPVFTAGCANAGGTPACKLGAISPAAAHRQLEAQVTVPVTAQAVTSVTLTATVSAAGVHAQPAASGVVTVLSPSAPAGVAATPALPGVTAPALAPSLVPGGNAGTLFPALTPATGSAPGTPGPGGTQPVADTATLSGGVSPTAAELLGAGALALALILAVTRLSVRRPRVRAGAPKATAPRPAMGQENREDAPGQRKAPPFDLEAT
jgi:hypothetical protein